MLFIGFDSVSQIITQNVMDDKLPPRYHTIYSLNRKENVMFDIIIDEEEMSALEQFKMFQERLETLDGELGAGGLHYDDLKSALLPPDNDRSEVVFVFNETSQEYKGNYIMDSFNIIVPILKKYKQSTMSIKAGDLIFERRHSGIVYQLLREHIQDPSRVIHPIFCNVYAIYFNNLSDGMIREFDNAYKSAPHYIGYAKINELSVFKSLISNSLPIMTVLCKGHMIFPEAEDEPGVTHIYCYYDLKDDFKPVLVSESLFGFFLSFRIDSLIQEKHTTELSFVAAYPFNKSLSDLKIELDPKKEQYLMKEKTHLSDIFGPDYDLKTIESFIRKLDYGHVYNVRYCSYDGHGLIMFNVKTSYFDPYGRPHKVTAALKVDLDTDTVGLISIF